MPIALPRGKDAWNEHADIIDRIAAGDADRTEELMHHHTLTTTDFYCRQLTSAPRAGRSRERTPPSGPACATGAPPDDCRRRPTICRHPRTICGPGRKVAPGRSLSSPHW
ncbi:hypothetical protein [Streptomyces yanii]|uniref:FCD domain-containing protein n=1 Tax=Streptomyces yanii TaxID=78510 RepID=A0ABV5RE77_9ACTN